MSMSEVGQGIARIRETDIQVTSEVLGSGRFGEVLKGSLKLGDRVIDVAFKTIAGRFWVHSPEYYILTGLYCLNNFQPKKRMKSVKHSKVTWK